jgi:two-component system, OmpR family, phosphate regulon response regulator OmpR
MGNRVLIIDDDQKLCRLLMEYLKENGFQAFCLTDGSGVLKAISDKSPDMIILDIMLPGKDGLEVLREIRKDHTLPVIMLTAKGEDTDRIVGLELGADDYLAKPFNPRELLARMKAVLRRSMHRGNTDGAPPNDFLVKAGGITLNRAKQTVTVEGHEIEFSTAEYRILEVLMKNRNTVLSRDQLMTLARGRDFTAFDRSIDVHVSKLRAKLESDSRTPKRIKTIWGTGYMFVDDL